MILSSAKKRSFLSDKKYLLYKGFESCDYAEPDYELMYLPFEKTDIVPKFKAWVREPHIEEQGFVLYDTSQCP